MINKPTPTLLEQLENSGVGVDVDAGDPEVAKSLPFKPHDMTSNQILVHERIIAPENKELVEKTIKEMKGADWKDIHIVLTARFHAMVIPHIQGRVLAQVSTSNAYNKQAIIEHARKYRDAYNAEGVSNDRFCIKIPTTTAGVQAAAELYKEGIRTLGTSLFSLHQALAAAQGMMLSISPYFNEVRAHVEQDLWPDVEDPATQHPFSARMIHIRDAYAKLRAEGKHVPLNKAASCVTARECMAMKELGADQLTILIGSLTDLLTFDRLPVFVKGNEWQKRYKDIINKPNIQWANWQAPEPTVSKKRMAELSHVDPLSKVMSKDLKLADPDVDYLADGVLDKMNEEDEVTRLRLKDALVLFDGAENDSKKEIQRLQALYNN
ncbi:putative transaldolase [Kockovaella imperatae]|uniref:Putative transaldolase n=1 Tax=Kockovaella imperatae TaxID=4999 RepID=A0A1Y1U727_9TREE|nr:putative transaldolase [Kockovaella imperatae]ORX33818.1 putative transaldolase [Kockovaella imperatae]